VQLQQKRMQSILFQPINYTIHHELRSRRY
jgi:hypothetical protein